MELAIALAPAIIFTIVALWLNHAADTKEHRQ